MDLKHYNSEIHCKTKSMISGKHEEMMPHTDPVFESIGVLKAWLADDDLQEITVCSTNIGFVKTFTKSFRREGA